MKLILTEEQLQSLLKRVILEGDKKTLGIGGFPQVPGFILKDEPDSIKYISGPKTTDTNLNVKIPIDIRLAIVFYKKPEEDFYNVEFVAINSSKNKFAKDFVNVLDTEVSENLDKYEIHIVDSIDYFIKRTPTIDNFEIFKNKVIDFMKKYNPQYK